MLLYDLTPSEWKELFEKIDFTDTEKDIIRLKRRGWTWLTIAEELYISERQIYRMQNKIMKKIKRVILT